MTIAAAATTATKRITTASSESPKPETGDHHDKEEGWTQVQKEGKKKKTPIKKPTENQITNPITATTVPTVTTITTTTTAKQPASSTIAKKNKEKNKEKTESMEFSVNLKRRRDSGDSLKEEGEKKHIKKPPQETKIHSQTPSLAQPKGEKKS